MSVQTASTEQAVRDARALLGCGPDDGQSIASAESAIRVIIGRASEFFDFFVYAIASVLVFPKLFFPFVDALTGTLYSFAIFSLAFLARPVGSLVFMAIDRAYGRGPKSTFALFLLGGSIVSAACKERVCPYG